MTDLTFSSIQLPPPMRRRPLRIGVAALSAALAMAAVFGPGPVLATRLGAGETVGFATVTAADTITSSDVLADVAAAVRGRERAG